jgi:hypothetical protein
MIKVKAAPGLICPVGRVIIDDKKAVEVEQTTAVQRLINEGSLIIATDEPLTPLKGGGRRNKDA